MWNSLRRVQSRAVVRLSGFMAQPLRTVARGPLCCRHASSSAPFPPRVVSVHPAPSDGGVDHHSDHNRSCGTPLTFTFSNGLDFTVSPRWVRDHCQCPRCVDVETLQRAIDYAPLLMTPVQDHVLGGPAAISSDSVTVKWSTDTRPPTTKFPSKATLADLSAPLCSENEFSHKWLWHARAKVVSARQRADDLRPYAADDIVPAGKTPWDAVEYTSVDDDLRGQLQFEELTADPNTEEQKRATLNLLSQLDRWAWCIVAK